MNMKYDVVIIGGGAAGLLAAHGVKTASPDAKVVILEKMPRPGRKILFTGKGPLQLHECQGVERFLDAYSNEPEFRQAFLLQFHA
jgi:predicted flavoprotein YhiN